MQLSVSFGQRGSFTFVCHVRSITLLARAVLLLFRLSAVFFHLQTDRQTERHQHTPSQMLIPADPVKQIQPNSLRVARVILHSRCSSRFFLTYRAVVLNEESTKKNNRQTLKQHLFK